MVIVVERARSANLHIFFYPVTWLQGLGIYRFCQTAKCGGNLTMEVFFLSPPPRQPRIQKHPSQIRVVIYDGANCNCVTLKNLRLRLGICGKCPTTY